MASLMGVSVLWEVVEPFGHNKDIANLNSMRDRGSLSSPISIRCELMLSSL